jgi:hypothetical protein
MRKAIFLSVFFSPLLMFAQSTKDTSVTAKSIKSKFDEFRETSSTGFVEKDTLVKQARELSLEQFKTALATEKLKQTELKEEEFAIQHRQRSFSFQYSSSIVIFIVVIVIVLAGLLFSAWQFNFTLRQIKAHEKRASHSATANLQPQSNIEESLKNQLELSTTGIKANSSVLGVIILALSIAFFYLYILYVYPIRFLNNPAQEKGKETSIVKEK